MSDIKLFQTSAMGVSELSGGDVLLEKSLQNLFEANLETLLGVRFLASEFVTNEGGRMDTLGIDENNAPVVIEMTQLPSSLAPNLALGAWTGLHNRSPGPGSATAFAPAPGAALSAVLHNNGRYFIWLGATLTATGAPLGPHSAPIVITVGYN